MHTVTTSKISGCVDPVHEEKIVESVLVLVRPRAQRAQRGNGDEMRCVLFAIPD